MKNTKTKGKNSSKKKLDIYCKVVEAVASHLKAIVAIGTSVVAIVAALTGIMSWVVHQLIADITDKISTIETRMDEFHESSNEGDISLKRGLTRVELMTLMQHSPSNVVEIEKVARYYFCDLQGDWYMSSVYSEWSQKYSGDSTIIITCHEGQ